jgi:hypothetical protein
MGLYVNKIRFMPHIDGDITAFAIGKDVSRGIPLSRLAIARPVDPSDNAGARVSLRLN